ncbi:hypothetical protein M0812_13701 [Anaeramoeba flamelloides]|uniref:Serine aminopeptidase S33 domain-containing protein n=1 Tax=Anaeramoeba flamelloides TaxID=1746091 RepID=A0AAV7ZJ07_9EUKA|nr:hypothetical protein M0812_13701 [Anaeramoeba flamelloides]
MWKSKTIKGEIFLYSPYNLPAFLVRKNENCKSFIIHLHGLTEGMMSVPYLSPLIDSLETVNLISCQFRSAHSSWGTHSLMTDCEDLDHLLCLLSSDYKAQNIILIGHSTGCQDILWWCEHGKYHDLVTNIVLQAPVSDRDLFRFFDKQEHEQQEKKIEEEEEEKEKVDEKENKKEQEVETKSEPSEDYQNLLLKSKQLINQKKPLEIVNFLEKTPISAYRWYSLNSRLGDEDYFSFDLSQNEIFERVKKITTMHVLLVFSGNDEFVNFPIEDCKRFYKRLAGSFKNALSVEYEIIDNAPHNLLGSENKFVNLFNKWIKKTKKN